jgi:hypothetical protein
VENVERFFTEKSAGGGKPAHEPSQRERDTEEVRT